MNERMVNYKCETCGAIGELNEFYEFLQCPQCAGKMLPINSLEELMAEDFIPPNLDDDATISISREFIPKAHKGVKVAAAVDIGFGGMLSSSITGKYSPLAPHPDTGHQSRFAPPPPPEPAQPAHSRTNHTHTATTHSKVHSASKTQTKSKKSFTLNKKKHSKKTTGSFSPVSTVSSKPVSKTNFRLKPVKHKTQKAHSHHTAKPHHSQPSYPQPEQKPVYQPPTKPIQENYIQEEVPQIENEQINTPEEILQHESFENFSQTEQEANPTNAEITSESQKNQPQSDVMEEKPSTIPPPSSFNQPQSQKATQPAQSVAIKAMPEKSAGQKKQKQQPRKTKNPKDGGMRKNASSNDNKRKKAPAGTGKKNAAANAKSAQGKTNGKKPANKTATGIKSTNKKNGQRKANPNRKQTPAQRNAASSAIKQNGELQEENQDQQNNAGEYRMTHSTLLRLQEAKKKQIKVIFGVFIGIIALIVFLLTKYCVSASAHKTKKRKVRVNANSVITKHYANRSNAASGGGISYKRTEHSDFYTKYQKIKRKTKGMSQKSADDIQEVIDIWEDFLDNNSDGRSDPKYQDALDHIEHLRKVKEMYNGF